LNIEPAINIRKNASVKTKQNKTKQNKTKQCPLRREEVLLIKKLGYE
jgi:hypothetical protein